MLAASTDPTPDRNGSSPPRADQRRVPRVVVGIGIDRSSATALVRADQFARAMGAALTIVHVIPSRRPFEPLTRELPHEVARATPLVRACIGPVRRWTESLLGHVIPPGALVVGHGPVLETLSGAVRELRPDLVVLGPGRLTRRLLSSERRPLLVARPAASNARIIAATDCSDPAFPVLRRAVELGRRLNAEVTLVTTARNAEPISQTECARDPHVVLTSQLAASVEVVCADAPAPDAALAAARERGADLVIVGSRRRALFESRPEDDAGYRIACVASCSVLVVPLGAIATPPSI